MPADTTTTNEESHETTDTETMTITTSTELTVKKDATKLIHRNIAIHEVVGDSEFDRALVSSNADSDDPHELLTFGYNEDELPDLF